MLLIRKCPAGCVTRRGFLLRRPAVGEQGSELLDRGAAVGFGQNNQNLSGDVEVVTGDLVVDVAGTGQAVASVVDIGECVQDGHAIHPFLGRLTAEVVVLVLGDPPVAVGLFGQLAVGVVHEVPEVAVLVLLADHAIQIIVHPGRDVADRVGR